MSASSPQKRRVLSDYIDANRSLTLESVKDGLPKMSAEKVEAWKKSNKEMGRKIGIILNILKENNIRYHTLFKLLINNKEELQSRSSNLPVMLKDITTKVKILFDKYYSKRSKAVEKALEWPFGFVLSTLKELKEDNERWKERVESLVKQCTSYDKELSKKWNNVGGTATRNTSDRRKVDDFVSNAIKAQESLKTFEKDFDKTVNTKKDGLPEPSTVKTQIKETGLKIAIIIGILEESNRKNYDLNILLNANGELDKNTRNNISIMLKASTKLTRKLKTAFNQYYRSISENISSLPSGPDLSTFKGFGNKGWKEKVEDLVKNRTEYNSKISERLNNVPKIRTKDTTSGVMDMHKTDLNNFVANAIDTYNSLNNFQDHLDPQVNTENFEAWKKAVNEKRFLMDLILAIFEEKRDLVNKLLQEGRSLKGSKRKEDQEASKKIYRALEETTTTRWANEMEMEFGKVHMDLFKSDLLGPLWQYFPQCEEFDDRFCRETSKISDRVEECKASIVKMLNQSRNSCLNERWK